MGVAACIVALSLSLIPLVHIVYYQVDGFSPNVLGYLFGVSEECHVKALQAPHYLEGNAWRRKQLYMLMMSWGVLIFYAFQHYALDDNPESVFHVFPIVLVVDLTTIAQTSSTSMDSTDTRLNLFTVSKALTAVYSNSIVRFAVRI